MSELHPATRGFAAARGYPIVLKRNLSTAGEGVAPSSPAISWPPRSSVWRGRMRRH